MDIKIKITSDWFVLLMNNKEHYFPSMYSLRAWLFEHYKQDIVAEQTVTLKTSDTSNNKFRKNKLPL